MKTFAALFVSLALSTVAHGALTDVPQTDPGWMRLRLKPASSVWRAAAPTGGTPPYSFVTPFYATMFDDQTFADPTSKQVWINAPVFGAYQQGNVLSFSVHDLTPESGLGITDLTITEGEKYQDPLRKDYVYSTVGGYSRSVTLARGAVPEPSALVLVCLGAVRLWRIGGRHSTFWPCCWRHSAGMKREHG